MDPTAATVLPLPLAPRAHRETAVEATMVPTSVATQALRRLEVALWGLAGAIVLAGAGIAAAIALTR